MRGFAQLVLALAVLALWAPEAFTQDGPVVRLDATPAEIVVTAGETVPFAILAYDSGGRLVPGAAIRVIGARTALRITTEGVTGLRAGEFEIIAIAQESGPGKGPVSLRIPVRVMWPAVVRVEIEPEPGRLYLSTTLSHRVRAYHQDDTQRPAAVVEWRTSNSDVATVDPFGDVTAVGTGTVAITATVEGRAASISHTVQALPPATLTIEGGLHEVRTGDVQQFRAVPRTTSGEEISDLPLSWSLAYRPTEGIAGPAAPGQIEHGRFVADVPGVFTVVATAGPLTARKSFNVVPRKAVRDLMVVGQGRNSAIYTTDLWVFEGRDGRDYAMTGSKQSGGHAYIFDVTNPASIVKTDSIQVDARSVNDVKVPPSARYAVITREGASDRRNGIVILDLANPAHPTIASTFDDGLTGGVHNAYATDTHIFALSAGDKYVIIDVTDLSNPTYVSEYDHPDSRVHDVWVHDGLAYSSEWGTGVVVVDVGNGKWGGSIENPAFVTSFALPTGRTHAAFPYYQESTGKFYLFVGDEILNRRGLAWQGTGPDFRQPYDPTTGRGGYPRATSGYVQVVDFTDPEHPKMVARYEVPEYGTHNMWVEDDILYQAYYEGGLRVVDVSGELMGNLYTQGREIAVHKAFDPLGFIPNSPAAWGVMPHKGHIFYADINGGVYSVKLAPRDQPVL